MCGRFACYTPFAQLAALMRLPVAPRLPEQEPPPRYNVAPGTWITSLAMDGEVVPSFTSMWWGYRPHWAQAGAPEPINATVEKVATSRYFRGAFARHRCLVPADGWYEWLPGETGKQPYFLCREDRAPLWLAAIFSERADGRPGLAILTEPARGCASEVHARMPLALDDGSLEPWLDPELSDRDVMRQTVRHLPAGAFGAWPVSTRVNRAGEEGSDLMEAVQAPG